MEPFGMSISFAAILAICEKVAKGLYTIYRNTDLLSQATDSLIREVTILRDIAESLERSLKEHHSPKNRSSNLRSLHFVERARSDAQITLEKIDSTLFEMDSGSSTFSFINQIKAGTHLEEIAAFTQQLAAQRQSLTLTLELVTLLAPPYLVLILSENIF
jgi:phage shock protein A